MKSETEVARNLMPAALSAREVRKAHLEYRTKALALENRRLAERHDTLFMHAPVARFRFDGAGRIADVNPAGTLLLAMEKNSPSNTDFAIYVHADSLETFRRHRSQTLDNGTCTKTPLKLVRRSGTVFSVSITSIAFPPARGSEAEIESYITEEREDSPEAVAPFAEQLIRTQRQAAAGQLATAVAHEINSPLQGIASLLYLVKNGCGEDPDLLENIDTIETAFGDIKDRVKSLLDLRRGIRKEIRIFSLNDAIRETMALMGTFLKISGIKVNLSLAEEIPAVFASFQSLVQVFINLLNNSIEALSEQPSREIQGRSHTVTIRSFYSKKTITVTVADNGPGFAPSCKEKLFEPFYTGRPEGCGIGLFICREILSSHGGAITAENAEAGGALFTITLPAAGAGTRGAP